MPSPGSRRSLRRGLVAAAAVLVLVAGGAVAFVLVHAPGNVSHPNVHFTASTQTRAPQAVDNFRWPVYGFDLARTRDFPASVHPPFRVGWRYEDFALLEFPPVMYRTTLYLLDDDGSAKAIDATTGHKLWETKVGTLAAASPAIDVAHQLVFLPILSVNGNAQQTQAPGNGRIVALSMRTGRIVWSRTIQPGTESSPVVWGGAVYFGDQNGTVYALNVTSGRAYWTYRAAGAVKGGPALVGGVLYFGDYAGRAYALDAHTGHVRWAVGTNGAQFGFGSGNFYSSPAVAFGRVYLGNTDGRVYSFSASNGQLAWATSTGAYVYASPAVKNTPGLGPTVYVGSYDGNFYAFDARSGAIRWTRPAGGKISGSPMIIDNIVYYSDLGSRTTTGLDPRTGKKVFSFGDGVFNPAISDGHVMYLVGYSMLYEMIPRAAEGTAPRAAHGAVRSGSARPKR